MTEPDNETPLGSGSATASAPPVAKTVRLDDEENKLGQVTEDELRARIFGMRVDVWLRLGMGVVIACIFVWLNQEVMSFVRDAFVEDIRLITAKPPALMAADRLITGNVVMALIGATAVQVGVAIVSIVTYLFPKRSL